jgi:hypothetical protein
LALPLTGGAATLTCHISPLQPVISLHLAPECTLTEIDTDIDRG